ATIRTAKLTVLANDPIATINTHGVRNVIAADTGKITSSGPGATQEGLIDFNADVTITGANLRLHIDENGNAVEPSAITFTKTPTQIIVDPITNSTGGSATLFAVSVFGTRKITGNASFHFDQGLERVSITNDSNRDLVTPSISVLNAYP